MSEPNNVRFVENNGKWVWKCYDQQGSATYRSPEFDSEQQAREDYESKKDQASATTALQSESNEASNTSSESESSAGTAAPEGETSAGSASADQGSTI